jgi:uncharacterized protein (DUF488 family)
LLPQTIYTVGHSTRTLEEFVAMLLTHGVKAVADVRRFPGSRRLPWFNSANMAEALPGMGLSYWPFPGLGGRRRARVHSPNLGWRNEGFRGYADYMQTPEFVAALEELMDRARTIPTATMCAEAVPWRCHRSLIADGLLIRGWRVLNIFDARKVSPHKLTPFAKVDGLLVTYPPEAQTSSPTLFSN